MASSGNVRIEEWYVRPPLGTNVISDSVDMPQNGWITRVGVHAGGHQQSVRAQVAVWRDEQLPLIFASELQTWSPERLWRYGYPSKGLRKAAGRMQVGFWTAQDVGREFSTKSVGLHEEGFHTGSSAPDPHPRWDDLDGGGLSCFIDYQENLKPLAGSWVGNTPSGESPGDPALTPFEGTMPHQSGDADYDFTSLVQVVIVREDTGADISPAAFEPTAAEIAAGKFSRTFSVPINVPCKATYRHRDSWGLYADWSATTRFTRGPGPKEPTNLSPAGRLDAIDGYSYSATYTHTDALAADAIQIQLYNGLGTVLLEDSGTVLKAVAHGATWTHPEFHSPRQWGSDYKWTARARSNGVWGPWARLQAFKTNSLPRIPTKLSPGGNSLTPSGVITAEVSDPDGDTIREVRVDIFDLTTNAAVVGYPKTATTIQNGLFTFDATADLVNGHDYQFRLQASDGIIYGDYTGWETFLYRQAPKVELISPSRGGLKNLVAEPSAEYAPGAYWTEVGATATRFVQRVNDGDAAYGDYAWRAVPDGSIGYERHGAMHNVDATKAILLTGKFKKEDNTLPASAHFRLACFDSAGARLGHVTPISNGGGLSGSDVSSQWKGYGGIVYPAGHANATRLFTGTTRVRIEILPMTPAVAGTALSPVRFDAFPLIVLPAVPTEATWDATKHLYGYFDGDTVGYRPGGTDYVWTGTPGASESTGLNILTERPTSISFSYSSASNLTKVSDRLLIDRLDPTTLKYTRVYETPFEGGTRTVIPVPASVFANEAHYRVKVEARDTDAQTGSTPWIHLDVRAQGPPELILTDRIADPLNATLTLKWVPSELNPLEFGGIEVVVVTEAEGEVFVALLTDPDASGYTYHYPPSGVEHTLKVRQIRSVGTEQLDGRWTTTRMSVNYYPFYFLKSVEDPGVIIPFEPLRGQLPGYDSNAEIDEYLPLLRRTPTHHVGHSRYSSGELTMTLWDDPLLAEAGMTYRERVRAIDRSNRFACILSHLPSEKHFVVLKSIKYQTDEFLDPNVSTSWTETTYEEDIYKREGIKLNG